MILKEINETGSSKKELKSFGKTMAIAFFLLAGLFLWRGKSWYIYSAACAALFLAAAYLVPAALKPVHKAWMAFSLVLGWIMTRVILVFVFYFIVTPIAFVMRLIDRNFMSVKIEKDRKSYWIDRTEQVKAKTSYEKQF